VPGPDDRFGRGDGLGERTLPARGLTEGRAGAGHDPALPPDIAKARADAQVDADFLADLGRDVTLLTDAGLVAIDEALAGFPDPVGRVGEISAKNLSDRVHDVILAISQKA
jgi:hypothetical protein